MQKSILSLIHPHPSDLQRSSFSSLEFGSIAVVIGLQAIPQIFSRRLEVAACA